MIIESGGSDEREQEKRYREVIRKVALFPGSKVEYEQFKMYEVEIIDTHRNHKGVIRSGLEIISPERLFQGSDIEMRNYLVDQGIEALINTAYCNLAEMGPADTNSCVLNFSIGYYGLPVRRKREK